ncbi:hypothetical protein [Nocardioides sp. KR10-350]|uniref:hypothetical protein n=1 Tax=Nocardioides cheoyonin TaxID=3156615 RepID=UPI0032B57230
MTRRRTTLVVTLTLAVLLVLGTVGVASAAWRTQASVSGTPMAGTVGLTVAGFDGLGGTLSSGTPLSGAVTVSNTGGLELTSLTATVAVAGTGTGSVSVAVWPVTSSTTDCGSVPSAVTSGTWASAVPSWLSGATLAAGGTATYCFRATTTSTSAAMVTPTVTVTGHAATWATAPVASTFTETVPAPTSPTTVTPAQAGIAPGNASTTVPSVTFPVDADGTLSNPYYFCVDVTVAPAAGSAVWSLRIDTTKPPYNSLPPASGWRWETDVTVSGPTQGILTVAGGRSNATITAPLVVRFCVTQKAAAPIMDAGPGTYSVSTPQLASCSDRTRAASRYDACVWTDVTGLYPHFYIGFHYQFVLADVVNASSLGSELKGQLLKDTLSGVEGGGGGIAATGGGTPYTVTVTSDGVGPSEGAITGGMTRTLKARLTSNG